MGWLPPTDPCAVAQLTCAIRPVEGGARVLRCDAPRHSDIATVVIVTRDASGASHEEETKRGGCSFFGRVPAGELYYASGRGADGTEVAGFEPDVRPHEQSPDPCELTAYLEPSLLAAPLDSSAIARVAGGFLWRSCDESETISRVHVRVGGTVYVATSTSFAVLGEGGAGGEVAVDLRLDRGIRVGPRLGVEHTGGSGTLWAFGARVHLADTIFIAADGYDFELRGNSRLGVLAGLGLEGRPGTYTGAVGLGLVLLSFLLGGVRG